MFKVLHILIGVYKSDSFVYIAQNHEFISEDFIKS